MASDLPDMGFSDGVAMARSMVKYIDCTETIYQNILAEFGSAPRRATISVLRRRHFRNKAIREKQEREYTPRPDDAYRPAKLYDDLENTNRAFLWLLDQERLASQRRRELSSAGGN